MVCMWRKYCGVLCGHGILACAGRPWRQKLYPWGCKRMAPGEGNGSVSWQSVTCNGGVRACAWKLKNVSEAGIWAIFWACAGNEGVLVIISGRGMCLAGLFGIYRGMLGAWWVEWKSIREIWCLHGYLGKKLPPS